MRFRDHLKSASGTAREKAARGESRAVYASENVLGKTVTDTSRAAGASDACGQVGCVRNPAEWGAVVQTESYDWIKNPPLLGAATSVVASLNRNLAVQAKDSIQIFSVDVLASREVRNDTRPSHVYPLGENHIFCVLQQVSRCDQLGDPTRNQS